MGILLIENFDSLLGTSRDMEERSLANHCQADGC